MFYVTILIMLGAVGFLVLSVAIGAYAYTSATNYRLVPLRERRLFVSAYMMLALAAAVWLATFFSPEQLVSELVFMTDIMLVAGTVCMLGVLVDIGKPVSLAFAATVGAGLLTLRAYALPSKAFTADGLLNFNLSQAESLTIGLLFLIVWLPATIKIVYLAFRSPQVMAFRGPISFVFISTVLMTSFFLSARRPAMIIISFISIAVCFSILVGINVALGRTAQVTKSSRGHHG